MTEMSPEISFAEYQTYQVSDNGFLVAPVTNAESVCLARDYNRYVYAFADNVGAFPGTVWRHVQTYKLSQLSTPANNQWRTTPPWIAPARDKSVTTSEEDGWGTALSCIQLPRSIDGQTEGIRYFFVMTRWPLLQKTVAEIARLGPGRLLPASMPVGELSIDGRHQKLISTEDDRISFVTRGTATAADYPGMLGSTRRYVFVVDVYTIAEYLAATLDANMTKLARFVDPASAANNTEKAATELRLARYVVAREVDMLRRGGASFDSQLATSNDNGLHRIDDILREMDPSNSDEGLGRLLWLRDRASRVLLQWLQSPLWDLLCKDARDTPTRAQQFYERHLINALYCLDPLASTPEGVAYFQSLYEQCLPSRANRRPPQTSNEFIAQNMMFVEPRDAGSWTEPVALKVARSIYALYVKLATPMAKYALSRLQRIAEITPDSELSTWASNPMQTNMGLTAYRWAYHLRNNFRLREVRAGDTGQVIVFTNSGESKSVQAFEIDIRWNGSEWVSRLGARSPTAEVLGLGFNLVGAVFSTGALVEAIRNERHTDTALLKTASAYMSLGQSSYVQQLLGRLSALAATRTGLTAVKCVGLGGAVLGAIGSVTEALDLERDLGETTAAWVTGVSGLGVAFIAGWASLSSLSPLVAAPSGWWILGGAALAIGGTVIVAAIKDSELERLIAHSVVGDTPGADHEAPGMALCRTGRFAEWAGGWESLSILQAQRDALHGVARAFAVTGLGYVHDYPQVRFLPQSLLPESLLEVSVSAQWTTRQGLAARRFEGLAQLHIGHDRLLRVVSATGEAFETNVLNGTRVIAAARVNGARCIDWIIAPSAAIRSETDQLLLRSVTLRMRLWITGLRATAIPRTSGPSIVIPVPRHGDQSQFLSYELVLPAPNAPTHSSANPWASPGAAPVAVLGNINTTEVWSTSAYQVT